MPGQYPIRVVSKMTGLSVDTLRAWERRYQAVTPDRGKRGRLYDDADVRRLQRLQVLVNSGYAIGQIAGMPVEHLDNLVIGKDAPPVSIPVPVRPIGALFAAIQLFDGIRLNEELGRLAALLDPAEFVHQVALPLMREVGERWHSGTMQTAHEHMVTESIRNLLGAMSRLNRPGEAQVRILATTPTDELHEVGVLAATILAGARGFHVTCLGPNLPAAEILFAAEHTVARVVVLGLTSPDSLPATREAVYAVASSLTPETELWLAGSGASRMLALDRPGTVFMEDFAAFERNLTRVQRDGIGLP